MGGEDGEGKNGETQAKGRGRSPKFCPLSPLLQITGNKREGKNPCGMG